MEPYRIEDDPIWLQRLLDNQGPFRSDAFDDIPEEDENEEDTPPSVVVPGKPKIDLRKFFNADGIKYTCTLCEGEFVSASIKLWWTKPDNKWNRPAVPICPECGHAGAITGWDVDWSERREMGPRYRKQKGQIAKQIQGRQEVQAEIELEEVEEIKEPKGGDTFGKAEIFKESNIFKENDSSVGDLFAESI